MSKSKLTQICLDRNLQELLKRHNIRLTTLASRLNINKSSLHGWANGVVPSSLTALIKISSHFELSLDKLCLVPSIDWHRNVSGCELFLTTEEYLVLNTVIEKIVTTTKISKGGLD